MYVVLADDQYDVRRAIKLLLEHEVDLQLTGEVTNDLELLALLAMMCPDLVLLDWELPCPGGRDLLVRVRAICPDVKVIALSAHPEARDEALRAGVQAFVSKGDPAEHLLAIVRTVLNGYGSGRQDQS